MWEFLEKNSLKIVLFFFGLLSLLYSIQADIIVQSDTFPLWVPFKALKSKCEERSLENITKKAEKDTEQLKYIFILDKSQSLSYSGHTPQWYNQDTINDLNDLTPMDGLQFRFFNNPRPFELCKVKLALLLKELMHKNVGLEIWELGNTANIAFTRNKILKGSKEEIEQKLEERLIQAFEYLINLGTNADLNTDFSSLFRRLCIRHRGLLVNSKLNKYKTPSFVLVILSDLIHDLAPQINADPTLQNETEQLNFFEERKQELMQKIAEVAEANLIANMILVVGSHSNITNSQGTYRFHLWEILNDQFVSSRLQKYSISDKHSDILYSNIFTEPALNFYYRNPVHISNSSIFISIPDGGNYRICLTWERKRKPDQIFTMEYEILDSNIQPVIDEDEQIIHGILSTTGEIKDTTLPGNNYKIKLLYSGPPPQSGNIPYFKVFYPEKEKVAFNIPIHFIKILPKGVAYLMAIFQILLGIAVLLSIWTHMVKPKIKFYKIYRAIRGNKNNKR